LPTSRIDSIISDSYFLPVILQGSRFWRRWWWRSLSSWSILRTRQYTSCLRIIVWYHYRSRSWSHQCCLYWTILNRKWTISSNRISSFVDYSYSKSNLLSMARWNSPRTSFWTSNIRFFTSFKHTLEIYYNYFKEICKCRNSWCQYLRICQFLSWFFEPKRFDLSLNGIYSLTYVFTLLIIWKFYIFQW